MRYNQTESRNSPEIRKQRLEERDFLDQDLPDTRINAYEKEKMFSFPSSFGFRVYCIIDP